MSHSDAVNVSEIPEHCPGTQSQQAGHGNACQGCPNQKSCQTAPKEPDPDIPLMNERMKNVKHKILVLSGKGGVGKSTVTTQLGFALASLGFHNDDNDGNGGNNDQDDQDGDASELQVGIMDIDICGPSIPKMMGCEHEMIHQSGQGWSPVYLRDNLAVMSIGFLLEKEDDAIIWRGPRKNGIIKQFIRDVDWGPLDYLLIDTPPGTSDEHLSIVQYLKESGIDGAVIVTTPQEVALQDVRKEINFCRKVGVKILGVIENMSHFICPKCQKEPILFPSSTGGAFAMTQKMQVPFWGSIPLDPLVGKSCDYGQSLLESAPHSSVAKAYRTMAHNLHQSLENCFNEKVKE